MATETVRTVQGDTFDSVSYRQFGTEHRAQEIMALNPEHADVIIFPAGVELSLPEAREMRNTASLPPWYREG